MPAYGAQAYVTELLPGQQATLFNLEAIIAGQASIPVALSPAKSGGAPSGISIELQFDGAPGAFELDVQNSDTDVAAAYKDWPVSGAITVVDGVNFRARVDLVPFSGAFARVNMKALANVVNTTAKIRRLP